LKEYRKLLIKEIRQETADAKSFLLQAIDGDEISYRAGQFLTFVFNSGEEEKRRSYSFSSAPGIDALPAITVKRVANGEFSRQFTDSFKIGDVLLSSGSSGFFVLPDSFATVKQIFLFAAGSGITPIYSLIKTILHHHLSIKLVLVYSNKNEKSTIFLSALRELEKRYGEQLRIVWLFSDSKNLLQARLSRLVLEDLLQRYRHYDKNEVLYYICGPYYYMLMVQIVLKGQGVEQANIKKENFNTDQPVLAEPAAPDTGTHRLKIFFEGQEYQSTIAYPDSILTVAKKLGLAVPYSCEAGRCGACAATCLSGKVWMAYNEVLMDDEIAKGKVLTCKGHPLNSDIVISWDK
jgi:ring-1,2-phenylacetyl-CoA epoxidase subunit PaaE